jgi:DUF3054 family protein
VIDQESPKPHPAEWLPTWEIIAVGLGDMIVLTLFAIIGRSNHGIQPSTNPVLSVLNTAFPFYVGWLSISAVLGAFSGKAMFPVSRVLIRTVRAALVAGPISVLLFYALRAVGRGFLFFSVQWSFMLVATVTTTVMLTIWRVAWSRFRRLWWPELP